MCWIFTWHGSFGRWHSCRGQSFSDTTGGDPPWQMFLRRKWVHGDWLHHILQFCRSHRLPCSHSLPCRHSADKGSKENKLGLDCLDFNDLTFHRNVLDGEAEDDGPDHSKSHLYIPVHNLWKANNLLQSGLSGTFIWQYTIPEIIELDNIIVLLRPSYPTAIMMI